MVLYHAMLDYGVNIIKRVRTWHCLQWAIHDNTRLIQRLTPSHRIEASFAFERDFESSKPLQQHTEHRIAIQKYLKSDFSFLPRSGDHTVKITCCFTRKCIRTFAQHTRTPWVVSHTILLPSDTISFFGSEPLQDLNHRSTDRLHFLPHFLSCALFAWASRSAMQCKRQFSHYCTSLYPFTLWKTYK